MNRFRVLIHPVEGEPLFWRKAGKIHTLAPEQGALWPAHFQPALFQVMADGSIVPRGTSGAVDIRAVEAVEDIATG